MTSNTFSNAAASSTASNMETFECYVCMDNFTAEKGVATCAEHFVCNDCLARQFEILAQQPGLESFPAQCCNETPIDIRFVEHLLSPEVVEAYKRKEMEFSTPATLRAYCSNIECHAWIPPSTFQERSLEVCKCETTTCVGCKSRWVPGHVCGQDQEEKPSWLPEYSALCRIKKCPSCRSFIELFAACNHVTCNVCQHQFCWVCLLQWAGFHATTRAYVGCPQYGDPEYDDEGFERNAQGLHRDTGVNREGRTRLEVRGSGPFPAPQADGGHPLLILLPEDDVYFHELEDPEFYEGETEYADFHQLECRHFWGWRGRNLPCNFCLGTPEVHEGHHNCSECGVRACPSCFHDQFVWGDDPHGYADEVPELFSLVAVIQWAEEGVAPFRLPENRHRGRWAIPNEEEILLGMQTLFHQYDDLRDKDDLYHGIEWLFQEPDDWAGGLVDEDQIESW